MSREAWVEVNEYSTVRDGTTADAENHSAIAATWHTARMATAAHFVFMASLTAPQASPGPYLRTSQPPLIPGMRGVILVKPGKGVQSYNR